MTVRVPPPDIASEFMTVRLDERTLTWCVVDDDGTICETGFRSAAAAMRWADDHDDAATHDRIVRER